MQKKQTRWLLLTLITIVGLVLSACGGAAPTPAAPAAEEPAEEEMAAEEMAEEEPAAEEMAEEEMAEEEMEHEPVTLTYWGGAPGPPLEPAMEALVDQFEEEHPWITVDVEQFSFSEYFQKLDTATAGGTGPDVFWVDVTNVDSYIYFDTIIPLTDFVDEGYADDWFEIPREAMYRGDELWAIPLHQSTEAMVYNQDIIDDAGLEPPQSYAEAWTLDEFRQALETVTQTADDGSVEVWGWTTQYPPGVYNVQPLMYAHGATYMDPDMTTYADYTNSDKAVESFAWYADLFKDGLSPVDRIPDIFQTGKAAFLQTNPFVLLDIQQRYPDLNFGVMPMPCGEECAVQSGAWHAGIHSQSEHPEEAWMLIDYITNEEGHKQWIDTSGYVPARKSVYEAMPNWQEYPWNVFMEGLIDHAVHRPANEAWPVFNSEMTAAAKNVAVGADPKEELDRVVEMSDQELSNY